ncbi:LOW QUALITY PROTEIN: protein RCC2 [Leptosomus discolor]
MDFADLGRPRLLRLCVRIGQAGPRPGRRRPRARRTQDWTQDTNSQGTELTLPPPYGDSNPNPRGEHQGSLPRGGCLLTTYSDADGAQLVSACITSCKSYRCLPVQLYLLPRVVLQTPFSNCYGRTPNLASPGIPQISSAGDANPTARSRTGEGEATAKVTQVAYRNLGQNLWGPHRYGCLSGIQVRSVVSGPCAAHSLLITAEGKLWSWGRNEKGQLGHGDTKRVEAPKLIEVLGGEAIVLAACGRNHTLALTESGSVFAFGENKMGQLGLGNQTDAVPSPTQIMYNGQPITKLACGAEFSMIMDCKGNLYSFGCPEYGQLGHNSDGKFIARAQRIEYDCELVPRRVAIFIEKTKDGQILPVPNVVVRDVACGANHTLILDSQKRVFSWGFGGYGRLGHAEQKDEMVPRLVKLFDFPGRGAAQIYAGYTCSFAVSEIGGLFFWGATNTSRESTMYPKIVQDLCGWKIRSLACGKSSIIVAADESTISWGPSPTFGELGYGDHKPKSSTAAQEVKTLDGIYTEQVAMGCHSLVIARDGTDDEKEKLRKLPEYNPRTI